MLIGNTRSCTKNDNFPRGFYLFYLERGEYFGISQHDRYIERKVSMKKGRFLMKIVCQCRGKHILHRICDKEKEIGFLMKFFPSVSIKRLLNSVEKNRLKKYKNSHSRCSKASNISMISYQILGHIFVLLIQIW